MSVFSETWMEAAEAASEANLRGNDITKYMRQQIVAACGPLPIRVPAGFVLDISQRPTGEPMYLLQRDKR